MARPQKLTIPKKGLLIGAKENTGFVDTFKYVTNVADQFRGDNITIEVDRKTDQDAPIIRLKDYIIDKIMEGGDGMEDKFHFHPEMVAQESGSPLLKVGEGAVQIGGYTQWFGGQENISINNFDEDLEDDDEDEDEDEDENINLVCVKVGVTTYTKNNIEIVVYNSQEALNDAQSDYDYYIFPLYELDSAGSITIDYRPMPNAGCWEF